MTTTRKSNRSETKGTHERAAIYDPRTCRLIWSGIDGRTPKGHCLALGVDAEERLWTWLFRGSEASAEALLGGIFFPRSGGFPSAHRSAYNPTSESLGFWVGLAYSEKETFARLAQEADTAKA